MTLRGYAAALALLLTLLASVGALAGEAHKPINTTLDSGPASVETQLFYEREVRYCYKGLIR
jgi:hypothetical protein